MARRKFLLSQVRLTGYARLVPRLHALTPAMTRESEWFAVMTVTILLKRSVCKRKMCA